MADTPETPDSEIDLGELFASLWAYKTLIGVVTAGFIVAGGLYALNAEKIYTSEAVFQLEDSSQSGLNLPSEMSGLAALAGLSGIAEEGNVLFDRVRGRAFIIELDKTIDLRGDDHFNNYNPDSQEPAWKAFIKKVIGYESGEQDPELVVEKNIVDAFRENVLVDTTDNGAISIKVSHTDPNRAAGIANAVMDEIVSKTESDTETRQSSQLSYLSETLADTLREMEDAQARLKNFAIENSTLSLEALAAGSVALDDIRNRLDRATQLRDAANALLEAVEQGTTDSEVYAQLRLSHPIIDDVEFRRVLGLSEIISEFTWPDKNLLSAVSATLEDRRARIEQEKTRLEEEAVTYANAAEKQAVLEREAQVAEASYTVLIEQVKAQSLLAGYRGETVKIFERAAPPLTPSEPNRKLVLALAGILGIFVGSGIALVVSLRKGVVFSRRTMQDELQPLMTLAMSGLKRFNGKSFSDIRNRLGRSKSRNLSEVAVALRHHEAAHVLVVNGGARTTARTMAIATAITVAGSGRKVAVVDLSRAGSNEAGDAEAAGPWSVIQTEDGTTELAFTIGRENVALLASPKFDDAVASLSDEYDLIVFSAEGPIAEMSASGLAGLNPITLLVGRTKRTPKALIQKLRGLKLPTILLLE